MKKRVKVVTCVQVGSRKYGPGRARDAALEYSCLIAREMREASHPTKATRDFNERQKIAFRRSLPVFEKVLGRAKNRMNPRTLIDIDFSKGTVTFIPNV